MTNKIIEIFYYQDQKGKEPFTEWFNSLEKRDQARIDSRLTRVEAGNMGDCEYLCDGIYELRFHNHSGFRIYFGYEENTIIILLSGGDKDTQNKDIEKAKYFWKDYKLRKAGV